jgi:predicted RNA polymerase sigma factor
MKRFPNIVSRFPSRTRKAVQDTVLGCRGFAAADVARASLMDTANGRRRFETSATAWATRADMIQRLDESSNARRALARAEWAEGESPSIVAANAS